ncbi:MAG: S8 family serine peptidase [Anaerolineae bacterium]|nr:S8 family serine peptidase [Anaerolineae bacterium]NUQ02858.1 S8 family serine peptidase [Anaerolineae bacterium]
MTLFKAPYPHDDPSLPMLLPTPDRLMAPPAYTGRGVTVAFVDSGFYMHPDLTGRILIHVDASTHHVIEEPSVAQVDDLSWHGQMTSVIACGDGTVSGGRYRGLAPRASLVLVKVSSPRGQVKERDILRGLRWLIDAGRRFGVQVVNMSVGGDFVSDDPEHPLHWAVKRLVEMGITVIAASGNRGVGEVVPPASAPEAIVVGGYDDGNSLDRARWGMFHSNYGHAHDGSPKPDVVAPARWIASPILPGSIVDREAYWLGPLLATESERALKRLLMSGYGDLSISREHAQHPDRSLYALLQARINGHKLVDARHQHVDGTSVAAAIATSVVAQMVEANPRLTPQEIRSILMRTAVPLPNVPGEHQGRGAINPALAVESGAQTSLSQADQQRDNGR